MSTVTRDDRAGHQTVIPVMDARAGPGSELDYRPAPAAPRRAGWRRLRRLARSYLRLAAYTCSALAGYGLALLLGFTPLSTLPGAFDQLQEHPRTALGIAAFGIVLAIGAALVLRTVGVRLPGHNTPRQRVARTIWMVLRAAIGSTLTTIALRYLCGLELLPSTSPLAQLAGGIAALLAALLAAL